MKDLTSFSPTTPPCLSSVLTTSPNLQSILFFLCEKNKLAADDLLSLVKHYDATLTAEKVLCLDIRVSDSIFETHVMLILATGLNLIWQNRKKKKQTFQHHIRAEIQCLANFSSLLSPEISGKQVE